MGLDNDTLGFLPESIWISLYTVTACMGKFIYRKGSFYLCSAFVIGYFCAFMNVAALISHVALWYGKEINEQLKEIFGKSVNDYDDIHNH